MRHRIRLINITPNDNLSVSLRTNAAPVTWRPVSKDGAALPPERSAPVAAAQLIGVGETYDFEYEAPPDAPVVVARGEEQRRQVARAGTGDRQMMAPRACRALTAGSDRF